MHSALLTIRVIFELNCVSRFNDIALADLVSLDHDVWQDDSMAGISFVRSTLSFVRGCCEWLSGGFAGVGCDDLKVGFRV